MRYDAVIFDLDGTLLNTLGDLRNAVNHAMDAMGAPHRTTDEVRRFVGNGVAKLVELSMPENSSTADTAKALSLFREYYSAHLNIETCPYEGIVEMLKVLKSQGIKVYVDSNKFDTAVNELCSCHFTALYDKAIGESDTVPKKPSPVGPEILIKASGLPKERILYVGDSAVDIMTAKNADLDMAWVSWGFRSKDEMEGLDSNITIFDDALSLTNYIVNI